MSDHLLSVDTALAQILSEATTLSSENIPLEEALGRIISQDIFAQENLPSFANSSMDGFALRANDIMHASPNNPVTLTVVMDIPAGKAEKRLLKSGEAARIMTGAPLPEGADAVVPVEDTNHNWSTDRALKSEVIIKKPIKIGSNIRPIGESVAIGDKILTAGDELTPAAIGLLASLGITHPSVVRRPRIAIISTGDELIEPHQVPQYGQIRDANRYTLMALVQQLGAHPILLPIARDTPDDVRRCFQDAINQSPDIILSSAGVSVGAADFVKQILTELGTINFWRINIRPGKPLAYGRLKNIPFFGLPGNPVSAMVTFDVFVRPLIRRLFGKTTDTELTRATLMEDLQSDGRRSYIRVRLHRQNGRLLATTTGTQSSGALISMLLADGLLIIPEETHFVQAGTELDVRLLRAI